MKYADGRTAILINKTNMRGYIMFNVKFLISALIAISISLIGIQVEAQATDYQDKDKEKEISGTVVDAATGEALSGIEVKLDENGETAETNEEGEFKLENLEPGSYTLIVEEEGYEEWSQTVEIGEEEEDRDREVMDEREEGIDEREYHTDERDDKIEIRLQSSF